ncbi:MAG: glycosyltransferase, partial [Lachnospiraceae bacterium]|nr:glycosyltransferase [Lachnospiraceae bacterium]
RGAAYTRHRGLRAAAGRYLCYLDADDYWAADKLEKQYRFMREKECAFSFTGYEFADSAGRRKGRVVHVPERLTYQEALTNTVISTITVMLDRGQIPEPLLFMPENCRREDTAAWWRILSNGYAAFGLDEALSVYCRHRGSHSSNKLKAVRGTWQLYRKQEGLPPGRALHCMAGYLAGAVRRRLP